MGWMDTPSYKTRKMGEFMRTMEGTGGCGRIAGLLEHKEDLAARVHGGDLGRDKVSGTQSGILLVRDNTTIHITAGSISSAAIFSDGHLGVQSQQ